MRVVGRGAKNECIYALQRLHSLRGYGLAIADVGKNRSSLLSDQETQDVRPAMLQFDRNDLVLSKIKRPADDMRLRVNVAGEPRLSAEGIKENAAQSFHGFRCGVDRHPILIRSAESPKVVKPHDVVSVRMRIHNGAHFPDACPKRLQTELRS